MSPRILILKMSTIIFNQGLLALLGRIFFRVLFILKERIVKQSIVYAMGLLSHFMTNFANTFSMTFSSIISSQYMQPAETT